MKLNALSGLLLATGLLVSAAVQAYDVELAISYDTAAENYAISQGTTVVQMIKGIVKSTNDVYREQGIPINLAINTIAKLELNLYTLDNSDYVTKQSKFRAAYNADYAVHMNRMGTFCGFAGIRTTGNGYQHHSFYSVTDISCGWHTFAHELGHNFGLDDPIRFNAQTSKYEMTPPGQFTGVYPYGGGYSEFGRFATIMVGNYATGYSQFFGGGEKVGLFSDSTYQHSKYGRIGDAGRDSAKALKNIAQYFSDADKCQSAVNSAACSTNLEHRLKVTLKGYDYGLCKNGCTTVLSPVWDGADFVKRGFALGTFSNSYGYISSSVSVEYSVRDWNAGGQIIPIRSCTAGAANNIAKYNVYFALTADYCFVSKK